MEDFKDLVVWTKAHFSSRWLFIGRHRHFLKRRCMG
jgi:hypothetical protein